MGAITAATPGGTSLRGGCGSIVSTVLGALLLAVGQRHGSDECLRLLAARSSGGVVPSRCSSTSSAAAVVATWALSRNPAPRARVLRSVSPGPGCAFGMGATLRAIAASSGSRVKRF